MSRSTEWAAALALLLTPLIGLTYAYPDWPAEAGLDVWNAPSLHSEIRRCQRQNDELDGRFRATADRFARKSEVIDDLIEGRISLREAALVFRELNWQNPGLLPSLRLRYPQASDDELHARSVLNFASRELEERPTGGTMSTLLEAELERLRGSDGEIRLSRGKG